MKNYKANHQASVHLLLPSIRGEMILTLTGNFLSHPTLCAARPIAPVKNMVQQIRFLQIMQHILHMLNAMLNYIVQISLIQGIVKLRFV